MDNKTILTDLRAQRDRLNQAIAALESLNASASAPRVSKSAAKTAIAATLKSARSTPAGKRVISEEARQRMAEAQRKRWAKKKRATKAAAVSAAGKPAKAASKTAAAKKPRTGITAAGRKRISDAAKARWAAKKAATTVPATTALAKNVTA
jgi:histone H1/5